MKTLVMVLYRFTNTATALTTTTMTHTQGGHTGGITQLAWGPGSKLLASTGADTTTATGTTSGHTLAVHAYPSCTRLHAAPTGSTARPTGLAYARNGSALALAGGANGLDFWVASGDSSAATGPVLSETYACKRGTGLTAAAAKGLHLCVAQWPLEAGSVVSGSAGGALCLWRSRSCARTVPSAHSGAPVTCLRARPCVTGPNGATTLAASSSGCEAFALVTGGQDGTVRLWSRDLAQLAVLSVAQATLLSIAAPRSVALSSSGRRVLVLTRGAELLELATTEGPVAAAADGDAEADSDATAATTLAVVRPPAGRDVNGGPLAAGHAGASLTALAAHPASSEFATGGDDSVLRVWGSTAGLPPRTFPLAGAAACAGYSADGCLLAVGLTVGQTVGKVAVLRLSGVEEPPAVSEDAPPAAEGSEEGEDSAAAAAADAVTAAAAKAGPALPLPHIAELVLPGGAVPTSVRFAPSGAVLAVGCVDGSVLLYSTAAKQWALLHTAAAVATALDGPVTAMDFTANSAWLRVSSSSGQSAAAVRTATGAVAAPAMTELRSSASKPPPSWATHTCLSHGSQGIYSGTSSSGSSVVALDVCAAGAAEGLSPAILAAGDAQGWVQLLKHPAVSVQAPAARFKAHCGPLSALAISSGSGGEDSASASSGGGVKCYTAGLRDRCVYQWGLEADDGAESGDEGDDTAVDSSAAVASDDADEEDEEAKAAAALARALKLVEAAEDEVSFMKFLGNFQDTDVTNQL
jgi:WD40 repeat protein